MHNATNERIKRRYFSYLREAKRHSDDTIDAVAKALSRFEVNTKYRDFKTFHHAQAIAFKKHVREQVAVASGAPLSTATVSATLGHLQRFFHWLAGQQGYKSRFSYSDADYFNASDREARVAAARRETPAPTVEQVKHAIDTMPTATEIQLRDRALVAFTLLTGARDSAIVSFKLRHIDLIEGCVYQDARQVRTKSGKTFTTYFFPVGDDVRGIVEEWVKFLRRVKLWGNDDPVFPATLVKLGDGLRFEVGGIKPAHWSNADPVRKIFRRAFAAAGLPYFNPHSLRNTLVRFGESRCLSPEEFKAWSQNLGHEDVLTTFTSYGTVPTRRQRDILRRLEKAPLSAVTDPTAIVEAVVRELQMANAHA